MKKDELVHMIAEAILGVQKELYPKYLYDSIGEKRLNEASMIVDKIASKLVIKRKIWVSGSIDNCPEYGIYPVNQDMTDIAHTADEDNDGFNKDDYVGTETFNLLEDSEVLEDSVEMQYRNYYRCDCGEEWEDEWDCMCNDKCPECHAEVEPYKSEDI